MVSFPAGVANRTTHVDILPNKSPHRLARLAGPCLSLIIAGFLLYAAFPPLGLAWTSWFALVPLMRLIEQPALNRSARYLAAWLGGLVFWVASLVWIWELHPTAWLGWLALALYQSLFWPIFVFLARRFRRVWRAPLAVSAVVAWLAVDYFQAHALSGFPWYFLAHAHFRNVPLIQVSDLFGAWAVTALVVLVNVAVLRLGEAWFSLRAQRSHTAVLRRLATPLVAAGLVAAAMGYGAWRVGTSAFQPGPRLALLQSNMRQALKLSLDPPKILEMYASLITRAFERGGGGVSSAIDLYIWPETSFPYGYVRLDPDLTVPQGEAAAKQLNPETTLADWTDRADYVREQLGEWTDSLGSPMLVGTLLFDLTPEGASRTNVALWLDPGGAPPRIYRKIHLVPFGEYMPFLNQLPFLRWLAPYDERNLPRLIGGRGPAWFDSRGIRYAPTICFEDTLPHLTRRFFREMPDGRPPDVLIDQSNDGWFNGSAEHDMHLAAAVFRAVEMRAPLVRAVNMGYSVVVDGNGQILASLEKKTEGSLVEQIPLDSRGSLYIRYGDLLAQSCLVMVGVALAVGLVGYVTRKFVEVRRSRELPRLPLGGS